MSLFLTFILGVQGVTSFGQIISSFAPVYGRTGSLGTTTIVITGTGFSATAANNIVFFGAVHTPALTATATELTVMVPAGATYQYLAVVNTETGLIANAYAQNPFIPTYYNEGSMQFSTSSDFSYSYGFAQPYFKITDFDGDGKPDIVFVHHEDSTIGILRNTSVTGTLSFDTLNIFYSPISGHDIFAFEIGDMNGDGKPDIVTRATTRGSNIGITTLLSIYPNTSTSGNIGLGVRFDIPKLYDLAYTITKIGRDLNLTDVDGDGKSDIILTHNNDLNRARMYIYRNLSTISDGLKMDSLFTTISSTAVSTGSSESQGVTSADYNGDGKVDLGMLGMSVSDTAYFMIFYNYSTPGNIDLPGSATVKFTMGFTDGLNISSIYNTSYVNAGDFDNDGKTDLATSNRGSGNMVSLLNLGTEGAGNFATRVGSPLGATPSWNRVADFDGDGRLDMAATGKNTNTLYIRRNNSTPGAIAFGAKVSVPVIASPLCFDVCDFDGDGRPDIVVVNSTTLSIQKGLAKIGTMKVTVPF